MTDIQRHGSYIEIDGRIRIEPGPRVIEAEATEELLDDAKTATHYRPPVERVATDNDQVVIIDGKEYVVGEGRGKKVYEGKNKPKKVIQYSVDARGIPIELGKPMTYVDWRSKWKPNGPRTVGKDAVWNVYSLEDPDGDGELLPRFNKKRVCETEEEAMAFAINLARELEGTPVPENPVPRRERLPRQAT